MGEQTEDGKIRIRCTGCGKRVKFPAGQPGQTFRCPICHNTIVAPIGDSPEAPLRQEAVAPAISKPVRTQAGAPGPAVRRPQPSETEQATPAVDRFNAFMIKETQRLAAATNELLLPSEETPQQLAARLMDLRHAKAVHIKDYAHAVLKETDRAIAELKESPAVETETIQRKLQKLLLERRNFLVYLNVMYELRPAAPAKPDTRGSAAAPPTTPSQPAPQTPPGSPSGAPAPNGTTPGSTL